MKYLGCAMTLQSTARKMHYREAALRLKKNTTGKSNLRKSITGKSTLGGKSTAEKLTLRKKHCREAYFKGKH